MMIAWLFWMGVAAAVALGAGLLAWALFGDRARGRPRCPKCWYDLSKLDSPRCPECGVEFGDNPRSKLRTRRRWKLAGLGAAVMLAVPGALVGREAHQKGFVPSLPNKVLIRLLPWPDAVETLREVAARVERRALSARQEDLLERRLTALLRDHDRDHDELRRMVRVLWRANDLRELEARQARPRSHMNDLSYMQRSPGSTPWPNEIKREAVAALAALLTLDGYAAKAEVENALKSYEEHSRLAMPVLLAKLPPTDADMSQLYTLFRATCFSPAVSRLNMSPFPKQEADDDELTAFLAELRQCGIDLDCAARLFKQGVQSDERRVFEISLLGLGCIAPTDAFWKEEILPQLEHSTPTRIHAILCATDLLPWSREIEEALRRHLESEPHFVLDLLYRRPRDAVSFVGEVEAILLHEPGGPVTATAGHTYAQMGGDRSVVFRQMLKVIFYAPPRAPEGIHVLSTLALFAEPAPHALHLIEPLLDSSNHRLRDYALLAFARMGGDASRTTRLLVDEVLAQTDFAQTWLINAIADDGLADPLILAELLESPIAFQRQVGLDALARQFEAKPLDDETRATVLARMELITRSDTNQMLRNAAREAIEAATTSR